MPPPPAKLKLISLSFRDLVIYFEYNGCLGTNSTNSMKCVKKFKIFFSRLELQDSELSIVFINLKSKFNTLKQNVLCLCIYKHQVFKGLIMSGVWKRPKWHSLDLFVQSVCSFSLLTKPGVTNYNVLNRWMAEEIMALSVLPQLHAWKSCCYLWHSSSD